MWRLSDRRDSFDFLRFLPIPSDPLRSPLSAHVAPRRQEAASRKIASAVLDAVSIDALRQRERDLIKRLSEGSRDLEREMRDLERELARSSGAFTAHEHAVVEALTTALSPLASKYASPTARFRLPHLPLPPLPPLPLHTAHLCSSIGKLSPRRRLAPPHLATPPPSSPHRFEMLLMTS